MLVSAKSHHGQGKRIPIRVRSVKKFCRCVVVDSLQSGLLGI